MAEQFSVEQIADKIYFIRSTKVMLDRDLAELYGVETRRLKEQVRRNIERFPEDFMFELTQEELKNWRSQFATSNQDVMGLRVKPFAFSEHGILMLSSVLKSERAISGKSSSSQEYKFKYPYSPETTFLSLIRLSIYILMNIPYTYSWMARSRRIYRWLAHPTAGRLTLSAPLTDFETSASEGF